MHTLLSVDGNDAGWPMHYISSHGVKQETCRKFKCGYVVSHQEEQPDIYSNSYLSKKRKKERREAKRERGREGPSDGQTEGWKDRGMEEQRDGRTG